MCALVSMRSDDIKSHTMGVHGGTLFFSAASSWFSSGCVLLLAACWRWFSPASTFVRHSARAFNLNARDCYFIVYRFSMSRDDKAASILRKSEQNILGRARGLDIGYTAHIHKRAEPK